jgi:hypothetical protein
MRILAVAIVLQSCLAQQPPQAASPAPPRSGLAPLPPRPDGKVRIFVGESEMFYSSSFYSSALSGAAAGNNARIAGGAGGASAAGVMKFTITVMKAIHDTCPEKTIVVSSPEAADYFLRLDTDGIFIIRAKMVAFSRAGEMSFVGETFSIKKDVKRFCKSLPKP